MNIRRLIFVIFFACIIELGVINFTNIIGLLSNENNNIVYDMSSIETNNYDVDDEGIVSKFDPMIIIKDINSNVKKFKIELNSNEEIPYIDIFYTNNDLPVFNEQLIVHYTNPVHNIAYIKLNKYVKDLRVDLGDNAGVRINNIKIIINPYKVDFSISRVIAMIMIYYTANTLLKLQKNPYSKRKEE